MVYQRLLAIWKYDDDIGYLCGEIEKILANDWVKIYGYPDRVFEPIKIIPYDEKYKRKLEELREEHREKRKELAKSYRNQFEEFIGGINK